MFLFVHLQVLLSVSFDSLLLVLNHRLLHRHELTHCVRLEPIQKVLQSVPEVFGVLVDHLRHHLSLPLLRLPWLSLALIVDVLFEQGRRRVTA